MPQADTPNANVTSAGGPQQLAGAERPWAAWIVAAMLAAALIGQHDPDYATARGKEWVEAGRGLDHKAAMEEGIGVAAKARLVGFALLIGAGFVCVVTLPRAAHVRWDGLVLLIVLGLLWAAASWSWSVERGTTARELVRLFAYAGVAAALARRFDPRTLCFVLAAALAASVGTSVAFEIATGGFRPWQADYRLSGTMHSNVLAIQSTVVAVVAYAFAKGATRRRAALLWAVVLAAVAIVVLTKTRTALGTTLAGIIAIELMSRPIKNVLRPALWGATVMSLLLLAVTALGLWDTRSVERWAALGRTEDVTSLTGRIPLWEFIWRDTAGRRPQGFGYGAYWLTERTESVGDALQWFPRHSHNAYLETIVNLGLVGLAIVLTIGLVALRRAWRLVEQTDLPEYRALAAILVAVFVNGLAEAAFLMPRDMGLFSAAAVFSVVVVHPQLRAALGTVGAESAAAERPQARPHFHRAPIGRLSQS